MHRYFRFEHVKWYPEIRVIEIEPHVILDISEYDSRILTFLAKHPRKDSPAKTLLAKCWKDAKGPGNSDPHAVHEQIRDFRQRFCSFLRSSNAGYRIDSVEQGEDAGPMRANKPLPYTIFPTRRLGDSGHRQSALDWGRNDSAQPATESVNGRIVNVIPYGDNPTVLKIGFEHKRDQLTPANAVDYSDEDKNESWWSATLGVAVDEDMHTHTIDVTRFTELRFTGWTDQRSGSLPLRVRFEDDSNRPGPGDLHQSSSWSDVIWLSQVHNPNYMVSLRDLKWGGDKKTFWSNTKPVNKRRILHLKFGHDYWIEKCSGTIYLENIRLTADE